MMMMVLVMTTMMWAQCGVTMLDRLWPSDDCRLPRWRKLSMHTPRNCLDDWHADTYCVYSCYTPVMLFWPTLAIT